MAAAPLFLLAVHYVLLCDRSHTCFWFLRFYFRFWKSSRFVRGPQWSNRWGHLVEGGSADWENANKGIKEFTKWGFGFEVGAFGVWRELFPSTSKTSLEGILGVPRGARVVHARIALVPVEKTFVAVPDRVAAQMLGTQLDTNRATKAIVRVEVARARTEMLTANDAIPVRGIRSLWGVEIETIETLGKVEANVSHKISVGHFLHSVRILF